MSTLYNVFNIKGLSNIVKKCLRGEGYLWKDPENLIKDVLTERICLVRFFGPKSYSELLNELLTQGLIELSDLKDGYYLYAYGWVHRGWLMYLLRDYDGFLQEGTCRIYHIKNHIVEIIHEKTNPKLTWDEYKEAEKLLEDSAI